LQALARELAEEGNIALSSSRFYMASSSIRVFPAVNHVALYVVRGFRQELAPQPNYEIIDHGFFYPDALPEKTSQATRRRLAEVFEGAPIAERW